MMNDLLTAPLRASGASTYREEDRPHRERGAAGAEETLHILYVDKGQTDSEVWRLVAYPINCGEVDDLDRETWRFVFPGVKVAGDNRVRYYELRGGQLLRYSIADGVQRLTCTTPTAIHVWRAAHPPIS